jgi:glycolate oxidase FAD binding subunit
LSAGSGLVQLDGANLTASVRAGTPSREFAAELSSAGFWLPPLDHAHCGTVGGDAATDVLSPARAALGGMRRWILGAEFVDSRGGVVRAGGKTMKNVAGYDLVRPLTGSHGRLGLITELTFRLWPMPEADITLHCPLHDVTLAGAGLTECIGATRPAAVAVTGATGDWAAGSCGAGCADGQATMLIRLAGLREDVAWAARHWVSVLPMLNVAAVSEAAALWANWALPLAGAAESGSLMRFDVPAQNALGLALSLSAAYCVQPGSVPETASYAMCLVSGQGQAAPLRAPAPGQGGCSLGALAEAVRTCSGAMHVFDGRAGTWPSGPLDGRVLRAFDPSGVFGGGGETA